MLLLVGIYGLCGCLFRSQLDRKRSKMDAAITKFFSTHILNQELTIDDKTLLNSLISESLSLVKKNEDDCCFIIATTKLATLGVLHGNYDLMNAVFRYGQFVNYFKGFYKHSNLVPIQMLESLLNDKPSLEYLFSHSTPSIVYLTLSTPYLASNYASQFIFKLPDTIEWNKAIVDACLTFIAYGGSGELLTQLLDAIQPRSYIKWELSPFPFTEVNPIPQDELQYVVIIVDFILLQPDDLIRESNCKIILKIAQLTLNCNLITYINDKNYCKSTIKCPE